MVAPHSKSQQSVSLVPGLAEPRPSLSERHQRWPGSQRLSYRLPLPLVVQQLWSRWRPPDKQDKQDYFKVILKAKRDDINVYLLVGISVLVSLP